MLRTIGAVSDSKNQSVRMWTRWTDTTYSIFWNPRTCPAVLFFSEAFMKLVLLILVGRGSVVEHHSMKSTYSRNTVGLLLLFSTFILYKIGITLSAKHSILEYFSTLWNAVDFISFSLLFFWAIFFHSQHAESARICLTVSAIPVTIGILEYLSVVRSLGQLVIIIVAMMFDLANFLVIYIVFIAAFGITFYGLFNKTDSYSNESVTFLTLYSASLNNFDFADFNYFGPSYLVVGRAAMLFFVTLTSIVLVNLLIARMSSTHSKITEKATQEWSYIRVSFRLFCCSCL